METAVGTVEAGATSQLSETVRAADEAHDAIETPDLAPAPVEATAADVPATDAPAEAPQTGAEGVDAPATDAATDAPVTTENSEG